MISAVLRSAGFGDMNTSSNRDGTAALSHALLTSRAFFKSTFGSRLRARPQISGGRSILVEYVVDSDFSEVVTEAVGAARANDCGIRSLGKSGMMVDERPGRFNCRL